MAQYVYLLNDETAIIPGTFNGRGSRVAVRDHKVTWEVETAEGSGEWEYDGGYDDVIFTGGKARIGVRNGNLQIDVELDATGFSGTVGTSWKNIYEIEFKILDIPTGLSIKFISDTEIQLNWTNVDTIGDGAKVYISTDGINYTLNTTVGLGVSTYNITGLTGGTHYYFYVVAYRGSKESDPSNIVNGWTVEEIAYDSLDYTTGLLYNTFAELQQKPSDSDTVILTYIEGAAHTFTYPKILKRRVSSDKGQSFGAAATIYTPAAGRVVQESHMGYSSDGRLHIMITEVDETTGVNNNLIYFYSDDDGATLTPTDITALVADATLTIFRNSSKIIENNGVMMCGLYRMKSDTTQSERLILRLVGGTWTKVSVEVTTTYINETSIIALSGDNLIALSRQELSSYYDYIQYKSADNGLTWTKEKGQMDFGTETGAVNIPIVLCSFMMNGEKIIAAYAGRYAILDECLYSVYGKASDILAYGILGWNYETFKTCVTAPNGVPPKQGDVLHYNNNYNAISVMPYHFTATRADLNIFEIDTTDYDTLFDLLFPLYTASAESNAFNAVLVTPTTTQTNAIVNLVGGLQQVDLWDKILAAYPVIGGAEANFKWNLKDPRDLDVAFRLNFVDGAGAGWTFADTGITPDGTGAYADTFLVPQNDLTLYSAHLAFYSRTNRSEAGGEMGAYYQDGANYPSMTIYHNYNDNKGRFQANNATGTSINTGDTDTNSQGFFLGSRTASNLSQLFYRGIFNKKNTVATYNKTANISIYIGCRNYNGTANLFSSKELAFISIGDGLTRKEAHTYTRLVNKFQIELGRNV